MLCSTMSRPELLGRIVDQVLLHDREFILKTDSRTAFTDRY